MSELPVYITVFQIYILNTLGKMLNLNGNFVSENPVSYQSIVLFERKQYSNVNKLPTHSSHWSLMSLYAKVQQFYERLTTLLYSAYVQLPKLLR